MWFKLVLLTASLLNFGCAEAAVEFIGGGGAPSHDADTNRGESTGSLSYYTQNDTSVSLMAGSGDGFAAFGDPKICYILNGILFVYAIILTVLYSRLKMRLRSNFGHSQKIPKEGIYTGLAPHARDTYETIRVQKKGMM